MADGWQKDKRWSDRFIPEISSHLGRYLITEPAVIEDQERNTDLMVLGMGSVRVACRIRKYNYATRYGNQFTIRSSRPSNAKTELRKVVEGFGDYIFYGFSNESETELHKWFIGNLNVFRGWWTDQLYKAEARTAPGISKQNADNSSGFAAFSLSDMPDGFVVAKSVSKESKAA